MPKINEDKVSFVGLLPAAGNATRISPLPCSKEIYPIGLSNKGTQLFRPKAVCEYLLESMKEANTDTVHIVLRKEKWDIPTFLGNGKDLDIHLSYLITDVPFGVPFTLDNAFPFIENKHVVFGFPDIIFKPKNAFTRLISQQKVTNADIVLGLFPATNPTKMDMVEISGDGKISAIQIKPLQTGLQYTWIIAVWNYTFTCFLHQFVHQHQEIIGEIDSKKDISHFNEIYLGNVIQNALDSDIIIDHVIFDDGFYVDVGTPSDMLSALRNKSFYNDY